MRRPRVFLTRSIPEAGLGLVLDACDTEIWADEIPPPRAAILRGVKGCEGLLALLTDPIDAEVMDAAPGLKVISNCAVGVDNIDLKAATARRIPVGNTPEVLTDATADLAFALLLAAARNIVPGVEYVKAGKWRTWNMQLLLGADLRGRTLGIIGFGRIGRAVARRASGFEMRVIYCDPASVDKSEAESVDLGALLRQSDFVSLHVPLTSDTRHLINEKTLSIMKPSAVLVNTSRGPVVDHKALYRALRNHSIFAAGLDVTEPEPLNVDNPLLQLDNCIVIPHLGSASKWTRDEMARLAAENLIAGLRGSQLAHCVNPEVYDR
jgi:lactate dehydrogenase-like 2-hydroxyacid dehydrogenase